MDKITFQAGLTPDHLYDIIVAYNSRCSLIYLIIFFIYFDGILFLLSASLNDDLITLSYYKQKTNSANAINLRRQFVAIIGRPSLHDGFIENINFLIRK